MSKKNILLLIAAVAVIAVFAFIVVKSTKPKGGEILQQQKNQTILNNGKEVDTGEWKVYRNEEYGFEVQLPSDCPKFNVRERSVDGITTFVEFGFLTNNPVAHTENGYAYIYGISVLTKDQYKNYDFPGGDKPNKLAEDSKYIFLRSPGQDPPRDLFEQMTKMKIVYSTFKFIEQ